MCDNLSHKRLLIQNNSISLFKALYLEPPVSDRDHFLDYLTFCKIPLVGGMMAERLTPGRPGSSLCVELFS